GRSVLRPHLEGFRHGASLSTAHGGCASPEGDGSTAVRGECRIGAWIAARDADLECGGAPGPRFMPSVLSIRERPVPFLRHATPQPAAEEGGHGRQQL